MRGGKPEHAFHRAPLLALRCFSEYGWLLRLGPCLAAIVRTEHRRSEMAGLRGHQQRAAVARIRYEMIDDVAEEMRAFELPLLLRRIRTKNECAFARSNQQRNEGGHVFYLLPDAGP